MENTLTDRYVLRLHCDGGNMSRREVQSDARLHLFDEFRRQWRLRRHLEEENDAFLRPVGAPLRDAQTVHNFLNRLDCQQNSELYMLSIARDYLSSYDHKLNALPRRTFHH